jgi:hypothetical protein
MTVQVTSDGAAVVDTEYFWIPVDEHTPRGAKLQLLGQGGVAVYANYDGDKFWTHWCPLPKKRATRKAYPSVVLDDHGYVGANEWHNIDKPVIGVVLLLVVMVVSLLILLGMHLSRMLP